MDGGGDSLCRHARNRAITPLPSARESAPLAGAGAVEGTAACALVHDDDAEGRIPEPQLAQPLAQHRGGAHYQAGLEVAAGVQPRKEHRNLDGLAQPCTQRPSPISGFRAL